MRIINFLKGIRNHWKKSTFAACVVSYGVSYVKNNHEISNLMRKYCQEAATYGDEQISAHILPKKVLVIVNPAANKRSAEKTFHEYCEPILHLAGYSVEIIQTDSVGHARRYIEELEKMPSAILVAGGDGTVSETVTGLLRRSANTEQCPIGILPVGRTNAIVSKYFNLPGNPNDVEEVQGLADAAIAIVRGKVESKNVMEVQAMVDTTDPDTQIPKPIYAMGSLQWGAFRDVENIKDKYWYLGPLREYAATLFNAFGNNLTWDCKATLVYTPPCSGCSNCHVKDDAVVYGGSRWWSRFVPKFKLGQQASIQKVDYSKILNEQCSRSTEVEICPTEIILEPDTSASQSKLTVNVRETIKSGVDFMTENWQRIQTRQIQHTTPLLEGRTIELIPADNPNADEKDKFYFIDNEPFEVRPIKISVIPNAVHMYVL